MVFESKKGNGILSNIKVDKKCLLEKYILNFISKLNNLLRSVFTARSSCFTYEHR